MRQITADAYYAFTHKKKFRRRGTEVAIEYGEAHLYLHGNEIAKTKDGCVFISSGGWTSNTTRERLNAFPVRLRIQKGSYIFNESFTWDGEWINISNDDGTRRTEME